VYVEDSAWGRWPPGGANIEPLQSPDVSVDSATMLAVDTAAMAAAGAAAIVCFRAASRGHAGFGRAWTIAMRRALRLLGTAAAAWGLGHLLRIPLIVAGGRHGAFPGPPDVALLAAIALAAIGMLAYPTAPARALAQVRTVLDGLLIAASLLLVCWATVLGPAYRAGVGPLLPRALGLAYPVGDVVAITVVISLVVRARGRGMLQPALLAAATVAIGVADAGLAERIAADQTFSFNALEAGWLVGYLLLGAAAMRTAPAALLRGDDEESLPLTWSRLALSYLPPAVACVVVAAVQVVRGRLEPFLVLAGAALGLLLIARQVTATLENQRLQRRLRDTVESLFQREAQLERALRRESEAAGRLRAVSDMKDTFLRAVSHDLRTPLTAMHGVAVTLERTRLNLPREQALELIHMMIDKTRKMDRLLTDLLDLNRMEGRILEPNRSLTDINELAHRVVDEVEQLRGWPIEIEAEPVLAAIDSPKVERIVENLLLNSTRHTPPGTQVWVRARTSQDDLELIVEDAGPGVPPELAGTIFEPFRQGRRGGTGSGGGRRRGVGIGLSLVARFAELHKGRAWVTERSGGGASFHVLLPGCIKQRRPARTAGRPREAPQAAEAVATRLLDR
jgi:signal transduction histidine kinase